MSCTHYQLGHASRDSKAKYYDGNLDNVELPEDLGASD
jgi:hypothetical protein